MHLLEMAKTAWNASIMIDGYEQGAAATRRDLSERAQTYLRLCRDVLNIFGQEGDPGGPLEEIQLLQELLDES